MTQVRWGIMSTAGIAQFELIPAFQRATNAEVVAISSLSGKAQEVAEQFHIAKAYDSYTEMLNDSEIDAVYIPLPNHLHKEWVIKAAEQKKHILCEKPAALTEADIKDMEQACTENNVIFMEAYMYHFHPQHHRVRELIKDNEIGEVKLFKGSFSFHLTDRKTNIRLDKDLGGGSLYDVGCYNIHAMRNILQMEPISVTTHAKIDPEYQVETSSVTYCEFEKGISAVLDSSFDVAWRDEYEVIGTEGRIIVPHAYRPDLGGGGGVIIIDKGNIRRTETVVTDQYRDQVENISFAIINNTEPLIDFDNTRNNTKVIEACLQSIETGGKVYL